MGSLVRALQHELGITELSDSFGAHTLAELTERGGIRRDETGAPVSILQCGLVCKGYQLGEINGKVDRDTAAALTTMSHDAGIPVAAYPHADDAVAPKTVKALLNLDSYRVRPNGSTKLREIQRRLNGGGHLDRPEMFVIACDGVMSRQTHRCLVRTIQFELGLSDEEATGSVNPATRAGLRTRTVRQGATGVWVRLFSAALTINGYGACTDRFDQALTEAVRRFQDFSALRVSGIGDYPTFAQTLVSNGDPERAGTACDGITEITPARARALREAGYLIIGRYLDELPGGLKKKIRPGELKTIFAHGLKVFPISQYLGRTRNYFTGEQGIKDAERAHDAAVEHGFNPDTVLYFAVDYDAAPNDVESHIVPYFNGVVTGLTTKGKRYVPAVYGPRAVCSQLAEKVGTRFSFIAGMSTGYTGNLGHPLPTNWSFNQIAGVTLDTEDGKLSIDKNTYRPDSDVAVDSINDEPADSEEFLAYLERLFTAANRHGKGNPNQLVLDVLRRRDRRATNLNREFIASVTAAGVREVVEFRDPVHGVPVRVSRLGAVCHEFALRGQAAHTRINQADLTGWGTDVLTGYGQWQRESSRHATGYRYWVNTLARDTSAPFSVRDLLVDVDGYNIGMRLREGANMVEETRANLLRDRAATRMSRMYAGRFDGNTATTAALTLELLTGTADPALAGLRAALVLEVGGTAVPMPSTLPRERLDEFCRGFAEVMHRKVREEKDLIARSGR
jgi:peptidoglycan hydrolase-like protein with peptidoglycan-binding domain